ncbi:MAG: GerMN domain-containing protein [Acidobacteriota bacterium]|nr:GerMN domain-containing protein [Acidobacteriota bacterium]
MAKFRTPLVILLAVLLVGLVYLFIASISPERIANRAETPETPADVALLAEETRTVTLFFPREDDGLFVPETRSIPASGSIAQEAEAVLNELIKGSSKGLPSALPPEAKVGQVFVTKDGTAYADFSKDLVVAHPSGSDAETSTVFAIVDTLAFNFKSIKKVFILVDGEEKETLNGHVTLDRAFTPDFSLVAKD